MSDVQITTCPHPGPPLHRLRDGLQRKSRGPIDDASIIIRTCFPGGERRCQETVAGGRINEKSSTSSPPIPDGAPAFFNNIATPTHHGTPSSRGVEAHASHPNRRHPSEDIACIRRCPWLFIMGARNNSSHHLPDPARSCLRESPSHRVAQDPREDNNLTANIYPTAHTHARDSRHFLVRRGLQQQGLSLDQEGIISTVL